jgi:hypothetical protein
VKDSFGALCKCTPLLATHILTFLPVSKKEKELQFRKDKAVTKD